MDVFLVFSTVLFGVFNGVITLQDDLGNETAIESDIMLKTNEVVLTKCKTGTEVQGECVERKYCEYGTPSIDFTIYAPRGYKKTCRENEVCCPSYALLPILPKEKWLEEEEFDFEEDE